MRLSEYSAIADLPHPFLLIRDDDLSSEVMMEGPLLCIGGVINGAVLRTAKEPGPVSVVVQLRDSVSEIGEFGDQWDAIEEGTVRLLGRNPRVQGLTGEIIIDLESLEPGTYRIRAGAAHRLRADSGTPRVRIELAKTETDTPTSTLRDTDGLHCRTPYTENYPILPEDQPHISNTVSTATVSETWERITAWCRHHTPDVLTALADPTPQQDIDAVESLFPHPWPEDLRTFYRLHNGFRSGSWAQILPEHDLLSLDGIRTLHREHVDLTHELAQEAQFIAEHQPERRDAGTPAGVYLESFVPIAERDGHLLVCDTRSGPLHGCITEYGRDTADDAGPVWTSLAALLADLATALESETQFRGHWRPTPAHGTLTWS
ncbi:SMI1/KNR4 family protein [Rhodococcus sp. IEGM 1379]|uniref:SMI1/KNR4 family protein n=1 Tax=Rhodococcus sp. IEGM 1379 TaxID=3047086 RepID=UPI0024B74B32|nr:SMI1/KNR4 family protein [Rhodococcus sp. IEGM 1379]MDI9918024.1 SMI1/KNR4 family protein [Rhodococcus sp. IEGM 1379]